MVLIIFVISLIGSTHAGLQLGYYTRSCPKAEQIVLKYVYEKIPHVPSLAAALIRLHFHDCFVQVYIYTLIAVQVCAFISCIFMDYIYFRVVMHQCF